MELPPELVSLVGHLLFETRNLQLEANLANLTVVAPHPAEFGPGLLALLERTENDALRATTSAAIIYQGEQVLPLVQDAFYDSTNDKYSGDLSPFILAPRFIPVLYKVVRSNLSHRMHRRLIVEPPHRALKFTGFQPWLRPAMCRIGNGNGR